MVHTYTSKKPNAVAKQVRLQDILEDRVKVGPVQLDNFRHYLSRHDRAIHCLEFYEEFTRYTKLFDEYEAACVRRVNQVSGKNTARIRSAVEFLRFNRPLRTPGALLSDQQQLQQQQLQQQQQQQQLSLKQHQFGAPQVPTVAVTSQPNSERSPNSSQGGGGGLLQVTSEFQRKLVASIQEELDDHSLSAHSVHSDHDSIHNDSKQPKLTDLKVASGHLPTNVAALHASNSTILSAAATAASPGTVTTNVVPGAQMTRRLSADFRVRNRSIDYSGQGNQPMGSRSRRASVDYSQSSMRTGGSRANSFIMTELGGTTSRHTSQHFSILGLDPMGLGIGGGGGGGGGTSPKNTSPKLVVQSELMPGSRTTEFAPTRHEQNDYPPPPPVEHNFVFHEIAPTLERKKRGPSAEPAKPSMILEDFYVSKPVESTMTTTTATTTNHHVMEPSAPAIERNVSGVPMMLRHFDTNQTAPIMGFDVAVQEELQQSGRPLENADAPLKNIQPLQQDISSKAAPRANITGVSTGKPSARWMPGVVDMGTSQATVFPSNTTLYSNNATASAAAAAAAAAFIATATQSQASGASRTTDSSTSAGSPSSTIPRNAQMTKLYDTIQENARQSGRILPAATVSKIQLLPASPILAEESEYKELLKRFTVIFASFLAPNSDKLIGLSEVNRIEIFVQLQSRNYHPDVLRLGLQHALEEMRNGHLQNFISECSRLVYAELILFDGLNSKHCDTQKYPVPRLRDLIKNGQNEHDLRRITRETKYKQESSKDDTREEDEEATTHCFSSLFRWFSRMRR